MKKDKQHTTRNPQDIIDSTYNARDFQIPEKEKDMNSYVMPLDMMRDVDAFDSRKFFQEAWDESIKNLHRKNQGHPLK
ncbi:hypothetical protein SAMN05660297_00841 [Natronincola peptidivorans]|uniref:Uncharacterized protein n=1 Tax=Natronincola peptidivorans TaxID=426128 RepID=A0A1I0A229_9FIRM|nr:hypothetical protein [Natronincola peptidivorans]SES88199.1 hypothetical protein SAMN05660297_00841 [Natronincola peptidivorans]